MAETLQVRVSDLDRDVYELAFSGQMEAKGADCFKSECHQYLAKGANHLILDLSGVTVISSSGIGSLLVIQEDCQQNGGKASFVALSKEVRSVVYLMGLNRILNITDSKETALQGLKI